MQNLNYNQEDIKNYIQSVTPTPRYDTAQVNFDEFLVPSANTQLATPEEIMARRQSKGGDLYQPKLTQDTTTPAYSQYGINYDVNGDGKVGLFEGMSIGGLINNIVSGGKEIGTGLTYLGTHLGDVPKIASDYYNDIYYKGQETFGNKLGIPYNNFTAPFITGGYAVGDFLNAVGQPYSLDYNTIKRNVGDIVSGRATIGDIASRATHRGYERATDITIDALTAGSGKLLKGVTKSGKAASKAQNLLSSETANVARGTEKIISSGEKVVKDAKNADELARAIEAAEQTGNWTNISPKLKSSLKEYSNVVDDAMATYSPATHINSERLSIIQKYARDNNITYQAAERIVTPVLEEAEKGTAIVQRGFHYSPDTTIKKFTDDIAEPFTGRADHGEGLYLSTVEDTARGYTKIFDEQSGTVGKLYEVELPKEDTLLKESLRFSEQPENVQSVIRKLSNNNEELKNALTNNATGIDLYRAVSQDAKKASKLLSDEGISGIKYYEGTPSEGVVIFKPSKNAKIITPSSNKLRNLEELAKTDKIAKEVLNAKNLFDKGDIFPITHGLAEVDKTVGVDDIGRIMAGRFSTRAFGNAAYEAIAKEIRNPNDYINQLTKSYLDDKIKDVIRNGGTPEISIKPLKPEDARYISSELLEDNNKSLSQALESAGSKPLSPNDIPIDKDFLKAIKDQYSLQQTNNPFGRTAMGDLYNLRKTTALASGGYLVGNLQTGLANAIINSNVGLIDDTINALLTKGKLTKNLGLFRRDTITPRSVTPAGKVLENINLRSGGYLLRKADSKLQNMFAEIAAHSKLRAKGVSSAQRLSTLEAMEGQQLGELVNDVRLISLMNPTKTITPRWARGVAGIFNPFWRWLDTAAQSSVYMLKNHPILANAVLFDVLAKAGYDKEIQSRLGIGVELDKPFVSYKVDPKTGEPREMSMEYLPQMNTLKVSSEAVDAIKEGKGMNLFQASLPLIGTVMLASNGLNKYGKPMYRDHKSMNDAISVVGGKRYRLNTITGLPEPVPAQADEMFAAAANEVLGSLNLLNKTVLPSTAWGLSKLTGKDYEYYLPYGQALFGSFAERGQIPTESIPFLMAGDPTRPRSGAEIGNMLRGIYETKYYPSSRLDQGIYSPTLLRGFYKGLNKRDIKEMNILMNR